MSNDRLLPVGSSVLEVACASATAEITDLPVPVRQLWDAQSCPVNLLPYLAWTMSVDRWDERWSEFTKRNVIASAFFVHQHKGTISALRRAVEPLGFLIDIKEWWQLDEAPGTFRLIVDVRENGITDEMYQELERLIDDAKPASRHLTGLALNLSTVGSFFAGSGCYLGDSLTIFPYFPEVVVTNGSFFTASAVHVIDNLRVSA